MATLEYDIVVYGGTFAGVAAAAKAAANAPTKKVLLINTDPAMMLGGIGTSGGQNYMDRRRWKNPHIAAAASLDPQRGTFGYWIGKYSSFYNTSTLSQEMYDDVLQYPKLDILGYDRETNRPIKPFDVVAVQTALSPHRITSLTVTEVYRDAASGYVVWGAETHTVTAAVFIDASDDGRLTRLTNFGGTTGRYDLPAAYLDPEEEGTGGRARQQVATLMFLVNNVTVPTFNDPFDPNKTTEDTVRVGDVTFVRAVKTGVYGSYGGADTFRSNPVVVNFNNTYGKNSTSGLQLALKPFNAAQNGPESENWWVNMMLIFNVDGRAHERDRNTARFPADMRPGALTQDEAWVRARNFIRDNAAAFLNAVRQFAGFENANLVYAGTNPVVGNVLYIRETIHNALDAAQRANGTENTNYAVTTREVQGAGSSPTTGTDTGNYATRIGLGYYWMDVNGYEFSDLLDASGAYKVGGTAQVRPDLYNPSNPALEGGVHPTNPVYLPYNAITTHYVANLLVPGYAMSASTIAWSALRVLPNLTVLGDAAGVAAAQAATTGKHPLYFNSTDMATLQNTLSMKANARLEK